MLFRSAVIKHTACPKEMFHARLNAKPYDSEEEAIDAILKGKVVPGDAVFIRYEGPRGSGMPEMFYTGEAICSDPKLAASVALITDGRFSGASIVFSIMAYTATNDDLDTFHIIFMIVLFSILLQGSMLPWISRKLDMLDKTADVMKTFNDYSEEADIQFIQLTIPENHLWCGHKLKDLTLPPETLIVLIRRGEQNIIPDGETIILQNDVLVLSAITPDEVHGIKLVEKIIEKDSRYNNKLLSEISKKHNEIIIMIQRNGQVIIPNGNVRLTTGDILVINRAVN